MVFYDSNRKVTVIATNENMELRDAISQLQIHIKNPKVSKCALRENLI